MDKTTNYKLIDGSFDVEEAKEILLGLIDYKIQFHTNKVFSTDVRFGEHDELSSKRALELKETRLEVEELLRSLTYSFKKLRITSTIKVEEIE